MRSGKFRRILLKVVVCALAVLMVIPAIAASAVSEKTDEIGYESYTYWYNFTGKTRRVVPNKPMYDVKKVINSNEFECLEDSYFSDVHIAKNGKTYLLDGGASRLIILDEDYNIINTISAFYDADDKMYTFSTAKGVFVDDYDNIYISDKWARRVLKCKEDGTLIRTYELPDSNLIPDGFSFQPIKTAVDKDGYVYILSDGSYYGAILYSPEDEFLGFYGSNDVAASIGEAISTLWNRLFMTDAQNSSKVTALPYVFTDLWIDDAGFVYTATGSTKEMVQTAQIKRLNPGGTNIIDSANVNFADEGYDRTKISGDRFQDVLGLAVDDEGFVYALDATYGRIFIYDSDCVMVTAFGGGIKVGNQDGTFRQASAITINIENDDVVVCDQTANTLTVFGINEYGKTVKSAQAKTIKGDYQDAMEEWTEVLNLDRNNQLAYAGLAKAYYVMGKNTADKGEASDYFNKAIDLAKEGYDRETYALAFGAIRTEWITSHFTLIMIILVLIIAAVVAILVYTTRHKVRLIKNEKVHLATTMMIHPFENFTDIKEKGLTSAPICLVIIILYYVFTVFETTAGGFSFVYFDPSSYNALLILAKTAGIVILWTVCNWAVCTLFSGKGKINEIFTVISYSLIPLLFKSIVYVVATNILVPEEAAFLSILTTICTLYSYLMLAAGSITMHDYSLMKFIGTTLLTLFGCAVVVFLLITVGILLQQTGGFIATIYSEILKLF